MVMQHGIQTGQRSITTAAKKKNEMSNEGQTEKTKFINSVRMYETKEIEQEIEDLQIHFFTWIISWTTVAQLWLLKL